MVAEVVSKFEKVDILVNCAGIGSPLSIFDISEEDWDRVLNINLKGVFLCCKPVTPHMRKNRYGKIVNISSLAAFSPSRPYVHYSASKAGVLGLTYDSAVKLGPYNICANAICPGPIITDLMQNILPPGVSIDDFIVQRTKEAAAPLQRLGTPEDVASVVLFLVSELSRHVTGDRILVSGGMPHRLSV
jgi:3-oxoacyl-[acyl-carrier protein] reductase